MIRKLLILITFISCTLLSGCALLHPYHPPIEQGNILNSAAVSQIRLGMTQEDVLQLLGAPVLTDMLQPNRWTYMYTYLPNHSQLIKKQLILTFHNGYVAQIDNALSS